MKKDLAEMTPAELEARAKFLKGHIPELQSEFHAIRQMLKRKRRSESRTAEQNDQG